MSAAHDHGMVEAEYGVVREVRVESDGALSVAVHAVGVHAVGVQVTVPGACDRCAIRENCYGAGSLVWAETEDDLAPGETVRLEMRPGTILAATAWVYGIPLAAVVAGTLGAWAGPFRQFAEHSRVLSSFGVGVAMMLVAGFVLSRLNRWIGGKLRIVAVRDGRPADSGLTS